MFSPKLNAAIPMDHRYLAENDGSEQAAGRGSGLDSAEQVKSRFPIPYMHMTYAPLERRLDMAIWRALFASSARQARQLVTHGQVTVNGQQVLDFNKSFFSLADHIDAVSRISLEPW
jgi:hypothetical protein